MAEQSLRHEQWLHVVHSAQILHAVDLNFLKVDRELPEHFGPDKLVDLPEARQLVNYHLALPRDEDQLLACLAG